MRTKNKDQNEEKMVTKSISGRIPLIIIPSSLIDNLEIANNLLWTTKDTFNIVGYITACRNDENASLMYQK